MPLDFSAETLPILDHYLREARAARAERPETGAVIATVAGCYLGEVLRSRHQLVWNIDADDPLAWKLARPEGALTVFPIAMAQIALEGLQAEHELEVFSFDPKLRDLLTQRLDLLPAVEEEEFVAPSTRVEVVDIAIDVLTALERTDEPSNDPPNDPGNQPS